MMSFQKMFGVLEFNQMHSGTFPHWIISHYSFLPTGYSCGSVGGALGRVCGSRVK